MHSEKLHAEEREREKPNPAPQPVTLVSINNVPRYINISENGTSVSEERTRRTIQRASNSQNDVVAFGMSFFLPETRLKNEDTDSERNRKILDRRRSWEDRKKMKILGGVVGS